MALRPLPRNQPIQPNEPVEVARGREGDLTYTITRIANRNWRTLRLDRHLYRLKITREGSSDDSVHLLIHSYEAVRAALVKLIESIRRQYEGHPHTTIQLTILARHMDAIHGRTMPLSNDSIVDHMLGCLYRVLQSKKEIPLDEAFEIHVLIANIPPIQLGAGEVVQDPELQSNSRGILFPPLYSGSLKDCCVLLSICLGLAYNEEKREAYKRGKKALRNPLCDAWKRLRYLHSANAYRSRLARDYLRQFAFDLCRQFGWHVEDFKHIDFESLREKIGTLNINVKIFSAQDGNQCIFSHPEDHDATRQTVTLYTVENPLTNVLHCGTVTHLKKTLRRQNLAYCFFCKKHFHRNYFSYHLCTKRPVCKRCRQIKTREGDWLDLEVAKDRCFSGDDSDNLGGHNLPLFCKHCKKPCYSEQCLDRHEKACAKLEFCDLCQKVRRKNEWQGEHICGTVRCFQCQEFYSQYRHHNCKMMPQRSRKKMDKMCFFDMETVCQEDGSHRPNAIGLVFETERGHFSRIAFYDHQMHHPQDQVLEEDVYVFDYLPDTLTEQQLEKLDYKVPKTFKNLMMPLVSANKRKRGQEEPQEVGRVAFQYFDSEAQETGSADEEETEEEVDEPDEGDLLTKDDYVRGEERQQQKSGSFQEFDMRSEIEQMKGFENSALAKFIDYICDPKFYGYTALSHNGAKFDTLLLLKGVLKKAIFSNPTFDDHSCLCLEIPALKLRFIDSFKYVKLPLASFGKRFPGIEASVKGDFPYRMNQEECYDYDGPVPHVSYFIDAFSSKAKKEQIIKFLKEAKGRRWNFKEELHKYLMQDCAILCQGAIAQVREFFDLQTEFERKVSIPFHCFSRPFITMPQYTHALWRTVGMPLGKIYLIDNQRNARKSSKCELEWLAFVEHQLGRELQTGNSPRGQKVIDKYSLDGWDEETKTCYEMLGCVVHGHIVENKQCPLSKGMHPGALNPFNLTCQKVHDLWREKRGFLERVMGFRLVCLWECEFKRMVQDNEEGIADFLEQVYYAGPRPRERLCLRDALKGGRTEVFSCYFNAELMKNQECFYIDKNSLYPTMAVEFDYPVGESEIFIGKKLENVVLDPETGAFVDRRTRNRLMGTMQVTKFNIYNTHTRPFAKVISC